MSFGFTVREDEWKRGENGKPHERVLKDVDLIEISPTPFPAYTQTSVTVRDVAALIKKQEEQWTYQDLEAEKANEETQDEWTGLAINSAKVLVAELDLDDESVDSCLPLKTS